MKNLQLADKDLLDWIDTSGTKYENCAEYPVLVSENYCFLLIVSQAGVSLLWTNEDGYILKDVNVPTSYVAAKFMAELIIGTGNWPDDCGEMQDLISA